MCGGYGKAIDEAPVIFLIDTESVGHDSLDIRDRFANSVSLNTIDSMESLTDHKI